MLPLFLEIISGLTERISLFLKALIFRLKSLRGYYQTIYVIITSAHRKMGQEEQ